ncbi:hypothetical protein HDC30_002385 [Pseudomonas sp. JAI115]|uniref:NfeD family protein n=1 Tax=Pseudomonas sp. JAI115 TaxID=2723061 RepID=UPI00160F6ED2|nr:NfeD family protein [Pseudomonas sp. JAI115]MBB6155162.1 hypothetical protein [Pseudomonas sp. JAI115]
MIVQGWMWIVLGLVLAVVEIATLGFFVFWFALWALLVSLLVWVKPDLPLHLQVLVWLVPSCMSAAGGFALQRRRRRAARKARDAALGEVGLITATVAESQKGRVAVEDDTLRVEKA